VIAAGGDAGRAIVHVQQNLADDEKVARVPASDLAALTRLEVAGAVTATQARQLVGDLVEQGGGDPAALAAARGFEAMDTSAVDAAVDEAIAADPAAFAKYCAGEEKAAGALVGRVMKATRGQADGKVVTAVLQARRTTAVGG
jgi:aspartyl-tRNA(Asn)/glutamyl-tRNA(Gln) amidotransferase subunit B